jgi:hypothetical protein
MTKKEREELNQEIENPRSLMRDKEFEIGEIFKLIRDKQDLIFCAVMDDEILGDC